MIIKNIFTDNLPRQGKRIDWKQSIGKIVPFKYDNIEGFVKIIDYSSFDYRITIQYKNKDIRITTSDFLKCQLGAFFNKNNLAKSKRKSNNIEIGQTFKDENRDMTIIDECHITNSVGKKVIHYRYKCNLCGFDSGVHYKNGEYKNEFWLSKSSLIRGTGCGCCCNNPQIVVEGINDIPTTTP